MPRGSNIGGAWEKDRVALELLRKKLRRYISHHPKEASSEFMRFMNWVKFHLTFMYDMASRHRRDMAHIPANLYTVAQQGDGDLIMMSLYGTAGAQLDSVRQEYIIRKYVDRACAKSDFKTMLALRTSILGISGAALLPPITRKPKGSTKKKFAALTEVMKLDLSAVRHKGERIEVSTAVYRAPEAFAKGEQSMSEPVYALVAQRIKSTEPPYERIRYKCNYCQEEWYDSAPNGGTDGGLYHVYYKHVTQIMLTEDLGKRKWSFVRGTTEHSACVHNTGRFALPSHRAVYDGPGWYTEVFIEGLNHIMSYRMWFKHQQEQLKKTAESLNDVVIKK